MHPFRCRSLLQLQPATVNSAVFHSDHSLSSRLVHRTNDKEAEHPSRRLVQSWRRLDFFRRVAAECSVAMEIYEREIIMGMGL